MNEGIFLLAYRPYRGLAAEWLKSSGYAVRTGNPEKYSMIPFRPDLVIQESWLTQYDNSLTRTLVRDIFDEDSISLLVLTNKADGGNMKNVIKPLRRLHRRATYETRPIVQKDFLELIQKKLKR